MISENSIPPQGEGWRSSLARAITEPAELLTRLGLPASMLPSLSAGAAAFPLRVPESYLARMRQGDPTDPLLLQVLPVVAELAEPAGFTRDPLGELGAWPAQGVLHKYRGRALLVVTGACAVHCRYCFRRHFPYGEQQAVGDGFRAALDYLAADPTIEEVLLSGGDPLLLPDTKLAKLAEKLAAIPHLKRLRVHTRTPVVLPDRVDDELLAWLTGTRLQSLMVLHINHAQEVAGELPAALGRLKKAGVMLLNQAVLLRGVNDSVEALADLSRRLFAAGVLPYYLNLLDRVQGAAHFEVEESEAKALMRQLTATLPGYLVPKLVREVAGAASKVAV